MSATLYTIKVYNKYRTRAFTVRAVGKKALYKITTRLIEKGIPYEDDYGTFLFRDSDKDADEAVEQVTQFLRTP